MSTYGEAIIFSLVMAIAMGLPYWIPAFAGMTMLKLALMFLGRDSRSHVQPTLSITPEMQ